MPRALVVGGGILGTFHALEALDRGWEVEHFDADAEPQDASARSPGALTPSLAAGGLDLELSMRARRSWDAVASRVDALALRATGSLVVAMTDDELGVLEEAASRPGAAQRGWTLLDGAGAQHVCPGLGGDIHGALHSDRDAVVEPRAMLGALREHLAADPRYRFRGGREIRDFDRDSVTDDAGRVHVGDAVVLCPGSRTALAASLKGVGSALRRVRLQLLQTEPTRLALPAVLADVRTLERHDLLGRAERGIRTTSGDPLLENLELRFNCVQRSTGALTVGEARETVEPFEFDLSERVANDLLHQLSAMIGRPAPPVVRRWSGIVHDCTDDRLWRRDDLDDTVVAVTGADQRGITLAPVIAADTFDWLLDGVHSGGSVPSGARREQRGPDPG